MLMKVKPLLFTFIIISGLFSDLSAQNYHQGDVAALMEILEKNSTWETNLNWKTEPDTARWSRIIWSNSSPARVIELYLGYEASIEGNKKLKESYTVSLNKASVIKNNSGSINEKSTKGNLAVRREGYDNPNLAGSIDFSSLDSLEVLLLDEANKVTAINISELMRLQTLWVYSTKIQSIDASRLTNLIHVHFGNSDVITANFEGCSSLEYLNGARNGTLNSINLSGCTNLKTLRLSDNQLNSLNLSELLNLEEVYCDNNELTSMDASNLPKIRLLNIQDNYISDLNLTNDTSLIELYADNNFWEKLNLSTCTNLEVAELKSKACTSIQVANLSKLKRLDLYYNKLDTLNIAGCDSLTNLNISRNKMKLSAIIPLIQSPSNPTVDYSYQKLEEFIIVGDVLDYSNQFKIGDDTTLFILKGAGNVSLDTNQTGIFSMDSVGEFKLHMTNQGYTIKVDITVSSTTLNEKDISILEKIKDNNYIGNNALNWETEPNHYHWDFTEWDENGRVTSIKAAYQNIPLLEGDIIFSGLDSLKTLWLWYNNDVSDIDVSGLSKLNSIYINEIGIANLDLTGLLSLTNINIWNAPKLQDIILSGCDSITTINIQGCEILSTNDFSGFHKLTSFSFATCQNVNNINISECTNLDRISIVLNKNLTSINFSGCTNLKELRVTGNSSLTTLDVTQLTGLQKLYCEKSAFKSINVSGLSNLELFHCYANMLESLDLTGLTSLTNLHAVLNRLPLSKAAKAYNLPGLTSKFLNDQFPYSELYVAVGNNIDFSSEAIININGTDSTTTFILYNNNNTPIDTNQTGIFTMNDIGKYQVSMTNSGVTIKTSSIYVYDGAGIDIFIKDTPARDIWDYISNSKDFGTIGVNETKTDTLVVVNMGNSELKVSDITMPFGYSVSHKKFTIPANNQQKHEISFNPKDVRQYNGEIIVHSNASSGDSTLYIEGYGASRIIGINSETDFGSIGVGDSITKTLTISNTGSENLKISNVTVPDGYSVSNTSLIIEPFATTSIEVTFKPTQATYYNGPLIFSSNATSGTSMIQLYGSGAVSSVTESTSKVKYVYPNPVKDVLRLKDINTNTNIQIYTVLGNLVQAEQRITENSEINVRNLENGIYILRIIETNESLRFIKQ